MTKSRDITLLTKVSIVKAMVFLVVVYGFELNHKESWVPKNWSFWTVVLEKTLENPLDSKEIKPVNPQGNQLWIFIYFGHLMQRANSLEKTLMLGGIGGRKRRGWQRMRWLDGITDSMAWVWVNSGSWWWTGRPGVLQFMGSQRVGHDWETELNWTELMGFALVVVLLCSSWLQHLSASCLNFFTCKMGHKIPTYVF